jgi:hypothetical protein
VVGLVRNSGASGVINASSLGKEMIWDGREVVGAGESELREHLAARLQEAVQATQAETETEVAAVFRARLSLRMLYDKHPNARQDVEAHFDALV